MHFKALIRFLAIALLLTNPLLSRAQDNSAAEEAEKRAERSEIIQHHLLDAHSFHIVGNIGFPLPVILWDKGLHVFMSSAFGNGEELVAESKGNYYKIEHGEIYKADANGTVDHENHPLDLSITKNVFVIFAIGALMLWLFVSVAKSYNSGLAPSGAAKFIEPLIIFVRDEIARPNIGEKHYNKYMGFLLSVFFFVWMINLTGLTPLGINVTGNIAVTAALAVFTFFITLYTSKSAYWKHIFWMPGVPVPMKIILAPIELLGMFIKPFALLIRLYANIKAGHIVLMSLVAVMYSFKYIAAQGAFFGLTFFLSLIELLVAFLQAYIFTMLSALYFGSAVEEHHHEEAHH